MIGERLLLAGATPGVDVPFDVPPGTRCIGLRATGGPIRVSLLAGGVVLAATNQQSEVIDCDDLRRGSYSLMVGHDGSAATLSARVDGAMSDIYVGCYA